MRIRTFPGVARAVALVFMVVPLSAWQQQPAQQAPERSRTEGLKETQKFIDSGKATSQSVAAAKTELEKTLTAYNNLVTQPPKDMKGDYKKLLKSMDSMNKKVSAATTKVEAMQAAGDTYFQGRTATIKNIQDHDLQQKAQGRLQDSLKEFGGVLSGLRDANGALEPFRKQLVDQIHFLGSDLNPSATASLKSHADQLNNDGKAAFTKADTAISRADGYFDGLKASS
jgi:chromosome segregation ATPase